MSGGGSSSSFQPPAKSCETLRDNTVLNSPVAEVIAQLKVGDVLDVRVQHLGQTAIVQAVHNDAVAGSITSGIIVQLVECVKEGHSYIAKVTGITGGACRVQVQLKP